jgi:homoserine dehydrogenase
METTKLKIGLFGFGVVGQGFYQLAKLRAPDKIDIIQVAVKNPEKDRSIPISEFTFNYKELLNNPSLQLVVEAIDDELAAYDIVKSALERGISVVSANKKLLANHLNEFIEISNQSGAKLLYEAAAAAAIPIIGLLDTYFKEEPIKRVDGIVNGTTNFILTKMQQERVTFIEALKEAQTLGFAESNPSSDVDGYDASYKITLLTAQAFGILVEPNEVIRYGIRFISEDDILESIEANKIIKLIATAMLTDAGLIVTVLPTLLDVSNNLASISAEFNAINLEAEDSGKHFFVGKGAGALPTGASILKDVLQISNKKYLYSKLAVLPIEINPVSYQLELIISHPSALKIEDFKITEQQQLLNGKTKSKGWIKLNVLKQYLPMFEAQEIGILSTGNYKKSEKNEIYNALLSH